MSDTPSQIFTVLDWDKPIQTCYGTPAELLHTLTNPGLLAGGRVISYTEPHNGEVEIIAVDSAGRLCRHHHTQFIVNRPEPKVWRNIYENADKELHYGSGSFPSEERARFCIRPENGDRYITTVLV